MFQCGGARSPGDSTGCAITNQLKIRLLGAFTSRLEECAERGERLAAAPKVLAQFLVGTTCGLSQMASDGMSRNELYRVVEHAAGSLLQLE